MIQKRLSSRTSRHIIIGIGIWFLIQGFFAWTGIDVSYAQSITEAVQSKVHVYNSILNGLYLLMRPALALAGFALDNGMIYGSLLGMDAPLWLIWNIVKNIANFALGFMVLFEILKNFFTTGESGKKAFEVIKKSLLAGILIQASWFLMAAVIDVSTITTYAVGSIPLSVLDGQCKDLGDIRTLPVSSKINFSRSNQDSTMSESFMYYYYVKDDETKTNFSPCRIFDSRWIIGQQYRGTVDGIEFQPGYCILDGNKFAYFGTDNNDQLATNVDVLKQIYGGENVSAPSDYVSYKANLQTIVDASSGMKDSNVRSGWLDQKLIFDVWTGTVKTAKEKGIYLLNDTVRPEDIDVFSTAPMLKDIMEKSEGYVGVLITLYKSILNFSGFSTSSGNTDTFVMIIESLLKVFFGIALLLPLIITAVALVIRIGYIWIFIALSPFLALSIAFKDGSINDLMKNIPGLENGLPTALRMIFAPVIITFAFSFCLVFMTALITSLKNYDGQERQCLGTQISVLESMNIEPHTPTDGNSKSYMIGGIAEVETEAFGLDIGGSQKDIFGWILINMFGVAIVWLLLMTVINAVFKGTVMDKLKLDTVARNILGSMPIIPVPTGDGMQFIGAGTAAQIAQEGSAKLAAVTNPQVAADNFLRDKKDDDKNNTTDTGTANTSTASTPVSFTNDDKIALGAAAATTDFTTRQSNTNLKGLSEGGKTITGDARTKTLITDTAATDAFITGLNDTNRTAKIKEVAEWFKDKTDQFTQEEITSLRTRTDDLAKALKPQDSGQIIKLSDDKMYEIQIATNGSYTFNESKAAKETFTPQGPQ